MLQFLDSPFLRLLSQQMRHNWRELLLLALISGISDVLLIVVINLSTSEAAEGDLNVAHLLMFVSMLAIHALTQYRMLRLAGAAMKDIVYGFRTRICDLLTRVELAEYEKLGKAEVQLSLGRDIANLSAPSTPFFSVLGTLVTTIASLLYLGYLSPATFIIVTGLNIGYGIYFLDNRLKVVEALREGSAVEGSLFTKVTNLFQGFKELKMNQPRRKSLVEGQIFPLSGEVRTVQERVSSQIAENFASSNVFYYIAVGVTLFILPTTQTLLGTALSSTITVMVFLFGNVNEILFTFSSLLQYDVSVRNLQRLERLLDRPLPDPNAAEYLRLRQEKVFEELRLSGASYSYLDSQGRSVFTVGPIELTIRKGELLFLVGGNGSGKSTLLRMLSGLYLPQEGTLSFNGVLINDINVDAYRQFLSTVFTDFHLFDQFYGLEHVPEEEVRALQKRFMLEEKTWYHNQHFSTLELSTGQRKRLALLTAILEARPILILDEVSADQDPEFRRFYYEELLPELIAQGRTVLVVSHDDRYFKVADRVLHMDYGRIDVSTVSPKAPGHDAS